MRLNLGCGRAVHPDWVNVDLNASGPMAVKADLGQPLPVAPNSSDCIYASHVLEHFPKRQAPRFLRECFLALRPGGIIRLAVPDLEAMARLYLTCLEGALSNDPQAEQRYDWILLEMFDQIVRTRSGGEMAAYWSRNPMPAEDFVLARTGGELRNFLASYRDKGMEHPNVRLLDEPKEDREEYLRLRASGELHFWMYDRFSLARLLAQSGFARIEVKSFDSSNIPGFSSFGLDATQDGEARKPDSLFLEGVKPRS
jgi:predicted SAM-dependent methyltransferase